MFAQRSESRSARHRSSGRPFIRTVSSTGEFTLQPMNVPVSLRYAAAVQYTFKHPSALWTETIRGEHSKEPSTVTLSEPPI